MSRYIDKDALIDSLIHNYSFYPAIVSSAIKNTPTADVAPIADTVQKMQGKLKKKMLDNIEGRKFILLYEDELDRIAQEIIEGETT